MNNYNDIVNKCFDELLYYLSETIGFCLRYKYGNDWWSIVLDTLPSSSNVLSHGDFDELLDSLNLEACLQLIELRWDDLNGHLSNVEIKALAHELLDFIQKNTQSKLDDKEEVKKVLDKILMLAEEIDIDLAKKIKKIYTRFSEMEQAKTDSVVVINKEKKLSKGCNLFLIDDINLVEKTSLTKKITFGGETRVYPVYRVRLDLLYYNDQNDRISTWISKYQAENGVDALAAIDKENYNTIIENFIYESNPDAIRKTQTNINLIGQSVPGVTLPDGRIVDGNRRFTCLRRLQRNQNKSLYFETVIMDMDIEEDKKQIKLLELAIQHGEEKKVEYDLIDYAIGTYRDVEETKLLTIEEYASGANESVAEVKKRIEIAKIICEFLEYLRLPGQYFVAREYQVYSLFEEMLAPLKKVSDSDKVILKNITFNNALMDALVDQRKFIRDIKSLVKNNGYRQYFDQHKLINDNINSQLNLINVHDKNDLIEFKNNNTKYAVQIRNEMSNALNRTALKVVKSKPSEVVAKCTASLLEIDTRLFSKLDTDTKEALKTQIDDLLNIVTKIKERL